MSDKPREFWITTDGNTERGYPSHPNFAWAIHVIEYPAYLSACDKAHEHVRIATQALKERDEILAERNTIRDLYFAEKTRSAKLIDALKEICAHYRDGKKNGGHMFIVADSMLKLDAAHESTESK